MMVNYIVQICIIHLLLNQVKILSYVHSLNMWNQLIFALCTVIFNFSDIYTSRCPTLYVMVTDVCLTVNSILFYSILLMLLVC